MLYYEAESVVAAIKKFLVDQCCIRRAEAVGDYRRRVEIIREISFLIETDDFPVVLEHFERYGGKSNVLEKTDADARLRLSTGMLLKLKVSPKKNWGAALILSTGSEE